MPSDEPPRLPPHPLRSVTNRRGIRLDIDPRDPRGQLLCAKSGNINSLSMLMWELLIGAYQWDLVVDVGANYGEMLAGVRTPRKSSVVAFEPNTDLLPYLHANMRRLDTEVALRPVAVADWVGRGELLCDSSWSGTTRLAEYRHRDSASSTPVTTLDAEFPDHAGVTLALKIDVEGGEQAVISGAENLLTKAALWGILVEVLHVDDAALSALTRNSHVYVLDKKRRRLRPAGRGGNQLEMRQFREDESIYHQDIILMSRPLRALMKGKVRRKLHGMGIL